MFLLRARMLLHSSMGLAVHFLPHRNGDIQLGKQITKQRGPFLSRSLVSGKLTLGRKEPTPSSGWVVLESSWDGWGSSQGFEMFTLHPHKMNSGEMT